MSKDCISFLYSHIFPLLYSPAVVNWITGYIIMSRSFFTKLLSHKSPLSSWILVNSLKYDLLLGITNINSLLFYQSSRPSISCWITPGFSILAVPCSFSFYQISLARCYAKHTVGKLSDEMKNDSIQQCQYRDTGKKSIIWNNAALYWHLYSREGYGAFIPDTRAKHSPGQPTEREKLGIVVQSYSWKFCSDSQTGWILIFI